MGLYLSISAGALWVGGGLLVVLQFRCIPKCTSIVGSLFVESNDKNSFTCVKVLLSFVITEEDKR